jgi:hypothetical protein
LASASHHFFRQSNLRLDTLYTVVITSIERVKSQNHAFLRWIWIQQAFRSAPGVFSKTQHALHTAQRSRRHLAYKHCIDRRPLNRYLNIQRAPRETIVRGTSWILRVHVPTVRRPWIKSIRPKIHCLEPSIRARLHLHLTPICGSPSSVQPPYLLGALFYFPVAHSIWSADRQQQMQPTRMHRLP